MQSLLRSETVACTALHNLLALIFREMFEEAFMGEHSEVLKPMVQVWPFSWLPDGDEETRDFTNQTGNNPTRGEKLTDVKSATRKKQLLKVMADLLSMSRTLNGFQTDLSKWPQLRRRLAHLCCNKMEMHEMPFYVFVNILKMLELNCVQEVKVCRSRSVIDMASFAP
ncbi:PRAME family member 7 [Heterocephalus glaber]|uniref:PRAME family member 7 n=1 Tax=Heterocephalus glaber TaxID=10181 RepID=G5AWB6_HETGA|nr:PRAME family member 7 [Heterocephalus glaber]